MSHHDRYDDVAGMRAAAWAVAHRLRDQYPPGQQPSARELYRETLERWVNPKTEDGHDENP